MTDQFVQELIYQYHVPLHIRKHMQKVAAVCLFLADRILKAQPDIQINLTNLRQAAQLHDFMKLCDFSQLDFRYFDQTSDTDQSEGSIGRVNGVSSFTAEDIAFWNALIPSCHKVRHVQAAYEILKELKKDDIAKIVKKHRFNAIIDPDPQERPQSWEEKILYYADKRVKHDQVVSIAERLKDGRKRYFSDGNIPASDLQVEKALYQLEEELLRQASITPEEVTEDAVRAHIYLLSLPPKCVHVTC